MLRLSSGNDAGCAKASSAITALSFSQSTYTSVFKSLELPLKEYCAGSNTPLSVYAEQVTISTTQSCPNAALARTVLELRYVRSAEPRQSRQQLHLYRVNKTLI